MATRDPQLQALSMEALRALMHRQMQGLAKARRDVAEHEAAFGDSCREFYWRVHPDIAPTTVEGK